MNTTDVKPVQPTTAVGSEQGLLLTVLAMVLFGVVAILLMAA